MKKKLSIFIILLFILFILIYPADCAKAAAGGLVLWYENILPALLPFSIFSNILIQSGYLDDMLYVARPALNRLFFCHPQAAYPIVAGFLFGFPIGSKTTADMLREGKLEKKEADILCAMCNNISPAFVSGYILASSLGVYHMTWITYAVLYLPPLICGLFLLKRQKAKKWHTAPPVRSNLNFQVIDAGIMNGFETLLKLGGYVMLFSLLTQMCVHIAGKEEFTLIALTGVTEVTNGIHNIAQSSLPFQCKYPIMMAVTAFGGLSGLAQTASMIKGSGISMRFYIKFRLVQTLISAALASLIV